MTWSGTSWSRTSWTPTSGTTPRRRRAARTSGSPAAGRAGPAAAGTGDLVSIEIANESGTEVDEADLAALARHVLDDMGVHPLAELSVLLVDTPTMTGLHERWMGEPGPTDVLAFPMDELRPPHQAGARTDRGPAAEPEPPPGLLGDVVLCPPVAADQARAAGHDLTAELELLTVHGILHLLGYDHADPDEHAAMFGLQDKLLTQWRSLRPAPPPGAPGSPADGLACAAGPGADRRVRMVRGRGDLAAAGLPGRGQGAGSQPGHGRLPAAGRARRGAQLPGRAGAGQIRRRGH